MCVYAGTCALLVPPPQHLCLSVPNLCSKNHPFTLTTAVRLRCHCAPCSPLPTVHSVSPSLRSWGGTRGGFRIACSHRGGRPAGAPALSVCSGFLSVA